MSQHSLSSAASAAQREKDERVLAVLLAKDQSIAQLNGRIEELVHERDTIESECMEWKYRWEETNKQAQTAQISLKKSNELVNELQTQVKQLKSEQSHHDVTRLQSDLQRKSEQIEDLIRELQQARSSTTNTSSPFPQQQAHTHNSQQQWMAEREEMASLILDQQQRLESLEQSLAQAKNESSKQLSALQKQVSEYSAAASKAQSELHAAIERERIQAEERDRDHDTPSPPLQQTSAILATKQREVEELHRQNDELRQQLRQMEQKEQGTRTPPSGPQSTSAPSATGLASTVDSLRAQLLLVESELSSKSHALSLAQLEIRELSTRLHQAEDYSNRAKSAIQASEARVEEMTKHVAHMNQLQSQYEEAQQQISELEHKLSTLESRERATIKSSADLESRLESQARETEALYQSELGQLKRMMQSMLAQTQNACGGAAVDGSIPALSGSFGGSNEAAAIQQDFQSVLASLSALTASRDLHKLSSIRLEKRIQFLERQSEQFQQTSLDISKQMAEQVESHAQAMEAEQKKHDVVRESLEQKINSQAQDLLRLQHNLAQSEQQSLKLQQSLDEAETHSNQLTLQLKRAAVELQKTRAMNDESFESLRTELSHTNSVVAEKTAQISVLMETIEALQKSHAHQDQEHDPDSSSVPSSNNAFQTISSKLISFAAQLSHSKAQEALLRRSLKSQESLVQKWRMQAQQADDEVHQFRHETIITLEKKVHALTATEKSHRMELAKLNGKLTAKNEELFTLNSSLQKSKTQIQQLESQVEVLINESKEARKRYVDSLEKQQEESKRTLQEYAKQYAKMNSDEIHATVTHLKHASQQSVAPLVGASLVTALKELSSSIIQATHSSQPIHAQLFSPFTPQKKKTASRTSGNARPDAPPPVTSPQFVLNSPSAPAVATVAPSSSEQAAILPAIFERLLNIVLGNESSLLHSEQSATLLSFQLTRLTTALMSKENENESLRHKFAIYSSQHEKLLHILKHKNDSTQVFLREQTQQMNSKLDQLQATLFQTQNELLSAQAEESHSTKHINQLRIQLQKMQRQFELNEAESAQKCLQIETKAEKGLEQKWKFKEEELKQYVEQVIRPLLINNSNGEEIPADVNNQIASLSATITSLKLIESNSLSEIDSLRKLQLTLQQQVDSWKSQCALLEQRVKEGEIKLIEAPTLTTQSDSTKSAHSESPVDEEKYSESKSSSKHQDTVVSPPRNKSSTSSRRPRHDSPGSPSSTSQSTSAASSPAHSPRRSRQSNRDRSLSPISSRSTKRDRSRSSRRPQRDASPASQNRFLKSQLKYYESREKELVAALHQSTQIQEQLEDTIEELIQTKRAFERQELQRQQEDEEAEVQLHHRRVEERPSMRVDVKKKSSSKSSSTDRQLLTTTVPASKSTKKSSSSSRSSHPAATKLEEAETSMSNSLAQTVLQITKQLRDREAVAADAKAEVSKLTAGLSHQKAEVENLAGQLAAKQEQLNQLQAQLTSKQSLNEASTSQLQQQITQLESTNATLRQQLAVAESQSTAASTKLTSDLQKLHQELLPSSLENAQLKANLQMLQTQLDHSMALENAERQKNVNFIADLKKLEIEKTDLQGQLLASEKEVLKTQDTLNKFRGEYANDRHMYEEEIKSREKEKLAMKNMLNSLDQSRAELHINHEHLLREKEMKENDFLHRIHELEASLTKELEERARINAREQDYLDRIQKLERLKQDAMDMQQQQSVTYQADLQAMKQANSILETTLNDCKGELEGLMNIEAECEVVTQELKALRCQHMEFISEVSKERENVRIERDLLQTEIHNLQSSLDDKSGQLPTELEHQKALYTDMINKLKLRIHQLTSEQEESETENAALERKLAELTQLNTIHAEQRHKAEQERNLVVSRADEMAQAERHSRLESENKAAVEAEIARQEFAELKNTFEEFRKGHEGLVSVYQDQHQRLLNRLKKALETVADLSLKREAKEAKSDKKGGKDKSDSERKSVEKPSGTFTSELARGRLVFDMAELLSNLSEREAVVRNLTGEIEQYKRLLQIQNNETGGHASIARPLAAILQSNTNVINVNVQLSASQRKKTPPVNGHHHGSNKENQNPLVDELPPLTWQEERSLAVIGGELAHMELQLKTAQRQALNEKEAAIHFEEQWKLCELNCESLKEKLKQSQKDLHALQRHTTGTIRQQEAEIAKITESLHTEEEWAGLIKSISEGKLAVKAAKDEIARKAKQLSQANEEVIKLKQQLDDLESSTSSRDTKIAKLTRALASKDTLVADLKKKFEEQDVEDKALTETTAATSDKLRQALQNVTRKEATIKELKSKLEVCEKESALQKEQLVLLQLTQTNLKNTSKELAATQKKFDDILAERDLFEKQKVELQNQLELWKTKTQIQSQGQKSDLAALSREASRIAAAYDTLRNLIRELALHQVQAIDQLSQTLTDLDRDATNNESIRLDGDISVRDVQTLSLAAEFSKEDLEDIISTTLRVDSNRPPHSRSRTSVYARRILADLEVQLARDLSTPTVLNSVREEFMKLLDERVRMELLVLSAATKGGTHASMTDESGDRSDIRPASSTSARPSQPQPSGSPRSASSSTRLQPRSSDLIPSQRPTSALDAAQLRSHQLREALQRHDVARAETVTRAQSNAREAKEIERKYERTGSNSPKFRATGSTTRFTAHIYEGQTDDDKSISSIDSR